VNPIVVFDATALHALFHSNTRAYDYWSMGDRGEIGVIFPATAIASANRLLQAGWDPWSALLWPERVEVAPLDGSTAVDLAALGADLSVAHTVFEARHVGGAVLTSRPQDYDTAAVAVIRL
jgi:hypothetical protein